MSFISLGLPEYLQKSLIEAGFKEPYPIQKDAIPTILSGKDVLGIAQTGSGKTASYVLPIIAGLEKVKPQGARHISVLVLVPTRELSLQVESIFLTFSHSAPFKCKSLAVFGGASINVQMQDMNNVRVLVATPGRLLDLIGSNAVHLSAVKTLVLDEADKMLNLGFKEEMDRIISLLPEKRQNLLFSATLSPNVEKVERILLQDPKVINVAPKENDVNLIEQVAYLVKQEQKGPVLRKIIEQHKEDQVLIFTSSVYQADHVVSKLVKANFRARAIHGKKSQSQRTEALSSFKNGKLKVLVATDILARGIDIEFLPLVINYELPRSPKDYVHRIGRTGRAENKGKAISIITEEDAHHFKIIQKKMKKSVDIIEVDDLEAFDPL
jgi:ATP-dependent RNA helicase RhlE